MLLKNNPKTTLTVASMARLLVAGSLSLSAWQLAAAPETTDSPMPAAKPAATEKRSGGAQCREMAGEPQIVAVAAGKSQLLNLKEPVTFRTIGDNGVAHAALISPTSLYIYGAGVGSTNMIIGNPRRCWVYDIVVQLDAVPLKATIAAVHPDEKGVVVKTVGDGIVLSGIVSNALAAQQIEAMARAYVLRRAGSGGPGGGATSSNVTNLVTNMMNVAAPQQVMLEVKVAEVSKTIMDQFGLNFSRAFALADGSALRFFNGLFGGQGVVTGAVNGMTGAMVGAGAVTSSTIGNSAVGATAPFGSGSIGSSTSIPLAAGRNATTFGIDAQKQDGLVKVLAEPTVMAISGQEGSFLAGGKIFIPVAQSANGAVTYTLDEREFGVSLRFRPTVLADGRINLQVNPEVSELSPTGVTVTSSASGATTVLPAFTTRKAATTVQLYDGQSFAIGGLIKNNVNGSVNAFPFLGEIPILGALFRSHSFQTDRSELVFVVTPRLVKPLPPDYALPTDGYVPPNRWDLWGRGKLEGQPPDKTAPSEGGFEPR